MRLAATLIHSYGAAATAAAAVRWNIRLLSVSRVFRSRTTTLCRWRHIAVKRLRYDSELHLAFLLGSISHSFGSRLRCDTAAMAATADLLFAFIFNTADRVKHG